MIKSPAARTPRGDERRVVPAALEALPRTPRASTEERERERLLGALDTARSEPPPRNDLVTPRRVIREVTAIAPIGGPHLAREVLEPPRSGGRPGSGAGPLEAPHSARAVVGPLVAAAGHSGYHYKFEVPGTAFRRKRAEYLHEKNEKRRTLAPLKSFGFDVYCDWDNEELPDGNALSDDVKFSRQFYTWQMIRKPPSEAVRLQEAAWAEIMATGSSSVEAVIEWAGSLHPRSISDYKPLLVLLQGATKVFLKKELELYSAASKDIRAKLAWALKRVAELEEENAALKLQVKKLTKKDGRGKVVVGTESGAKQVQTKMEMQEKDRLIAELKELLAKERAERKEENEEYERQFAELQRLIEELRAQLQDKDDMLKAVREKNLKLERELADARGKDKRSEQTIYELEVEVQELKQERERERRLRMARETNFMQAAELQDEEMEKLKARQQSLLASNTTPFFNWASYRPVVEMQWAADLVTGLVPASVPWLSRIQVPKESKLPHNAHILELPSGSVVHTPFEGDTELHTIAVPAFSMITFPIADAATRKRVSGRSGTGPVGPVTIPGGTSVIIPSNTKSAQPINVVVPSGTTVYPPKGDVLSAVDCEGGDRESNVVYSREPVIATEVRPGATLVSPMGVRNTFQIPSGCTFIFPMGQDRHMDVPHGSVVTLKEGGNSVIMVPAFSAVDLPDHATWLEDTGPEPERKDPTPLKPPRLIKGQSPEEHQPDCCLVCPAGTIVEVPDVCPYDSGVFKVTLPPFTMVVSPGEDEWVAGNLPVTRTVTEESIIVLPSVDKERDAGEMAVRMVQLGPAASSAAIGGLDPGSAAEALSSDALPAEAAAKILSLARPEPAAEVFPKVPPARRQSIADHMHPHAVACILASMPDALRTDVMQELSLKSSLIAPPEAKKEDGSLDTVVRLVRDASDRLTKDGPIKDVVDTLIQLNPVTASKLIAATQANKAAYALSRMAGRRGGDSKANACATELDLMANRLHKLSMRYNEADIARARLVEVLAATNHEDSLYRASVNLMSHFKSAYGIACTLARMPLTEAQILEEISKDIAAERAGDPPGAQGSGGGRKGKSANLKAAGIAAQAANRIGGGFKPSAPSGKKSKGSSSIANTRSKLTRQALEAQQAHEDAMELLISTEEVHWGQEVPGRVLSEADSKLRTQQEALGIDVNMSAKVLAETQEEALAKGQPVFRGVLLVVPVVLTNGTKWGTLSHIDRSRAATWLLGGMGPPANPPAKAYECLELMARAIRTAVEHIESLTKQHFDVLQTKMQQEMDTTGEGFDEKPLATQASAEQLEAGSIDLQSYMYWRRRLVARMQDYMMGTAELEEIKGYLTPPHAVVRLMASMFLALDHGVSGFENLLGPSLLSIPKAESLMDMWKYTRGLIQIDPGEPSYLPRLMLLASKGLARKASGTPEDLAYDRRRLSAVAHIMCEVKMKDLERASRCAAIMLEFLYVQFKCNELQAFFGCQTTDVSALPKYNIALQ